MRRWLLAAFLVVAAIGSWSQFRQRSISRADGVLAPDAPAQTNFDGSQPALQFKGATLHPLATFALTARVLSRDDYHFDAGAKLSPTDLAVGWGRMSDSAVLRDITIDQSGRYYRWNVKTFPIPRREIETHSANMHMIPSDGEVAKALKQVRIGDVITLDGLLVEADRPGGWRWRSSLTRDDTGGGACELIYIEHLSIGPR